MPGSRLVTRNLLCAQGRTTMRLEPEFWDMLREISRREGLSLNAIMRDIDATRGGHGRTGAFRVFILNYCRVATTELTHAAVGHGPLPNRVERSSSIFSAARPSLPL
jgi:predicted DNA-binding ribbon-helix-helix protein